MALRAWLRSVLSLRDALADISQQHLARACCEMSRRDGAIVAWHEVPGKAPPKKSRPVGYGVIRVGVRTDSMIAVAKFRMQKLETFVLYHFWPTIQFLSMANTFSRLNIHYVFSTKDRVWVLNPDIRERLWPDMGY
jgi:hypothetical protein